jgi:ABC-2 type transport system permease protein
MQIRYYLDLWKEYVKLNVETWTEYRMDFFVGIFAMFASNLTSIVLFWTLYQNIVQINGWTFWQLVFLSGLAALSGGIWHAFLVGTAPWRIERHIRDGTFDRFLLYPVNTFLCMLISKIDDDGFGDLFAGLLIVYVGATMSGIVFDIQTILTMASFVIGGALIFFSITVAVSSITFWVVRSGAIGEIIWSLMKFTDLPLEVYNPAISFFLTFVLPLGFINYYPAQFFLGKGVPGVAYLTPVVGIIFFIISYKLWKIGIKNYASTGS